MTSSFRPVRFIMLTLVGVLSLTVAALSHEYVSGQIKVDHPWSRATPPGASMGVGYMKLSNGGSKPVRLVGASSPVAKSVEPHTMSMNGGMMQMRPLSEGVVVPAGGAVEFKPGGMHLMLIGLKKPLVEKEFVPLTLHFEGGVGVNIELYVESTGAASSGHGH